MPLHSVYNNLQGNKTVLLIHGLAAHSRTWNSTVKYLNNHNYNTLTVDLTGHGSSVRKDKYSYLDWADEIQAVCNKHGITPDYIIAHSLGGLLALKLALQIKVQKLFLIDPLLHIPTKTGQWFFKQTMMLMRYRELRKVSKIKKYETYQKVMENGAGIYTWDPNSLHSFNREEGKNIVETFLNKTHIPDIVLLKPKRSFIIKKSHLSRLSYRNAEIIEISKAGHNLHKQNIREYMQALKIFLKK